MGFCEIGRLERLEPEFAICKINSTENVDFSREFVFLSKTDKELSLVCEADAIPADALKSEGGWKAMRIPGELDFGLIGVIAEISGALADAGISVFVISTYDTDYILVKEENYEQAENAILRHVMQP